MAEAGLVYDLLTKTPHLPAAVETVAALPELTFVVDHISKPVVGGDLEPWATDLRSLAALPNVSCKLSGMVTEASWADWKVSDLKPYVEVVLDAFGPDRVMFGSDWPVCLLAASYAEVVEAAETLTADLTPDGAERHLRRQRPPHLPALATGPAVRDSPAPRPPDLWPPPEL